MKSLLTKLCLKDNARRSRDTWNTCRRHPNRRGRYISSIYTTYSKANEKLHDGHCMHWWSHDTHHFCFSTSGTSAPSHTLCHRHYRLQRLVHRVHLLPIKLHRIWSSVDATIALNPPSTQRLRPILCRRNAETTLLRIASKDFSRRIQGKIMRCYCPTIAPVECIGDDGENQTDGCPPISCPHCRGTIENGVKSPDANGVMCRTQGEVVRIVDGAYYFPSP